MGTQLKRVEILVAFQKACTDFLEHRTDSIEKSLESYTHAEVIFCEDGDLYIDHQLISLEDQEAIAVNVAIEREVQNFIYRNLPELKH